MAEATPTAFSEETRQHARELVEQLHELVSGGGKESPQGSDDRPTNRQKKTMAQVADRVVTLVSDNVATVAGKVQQVAPEVWKVMIRQQVATVIGDTVAPLVAIIVTLIIWYFGSPIWPKPEYQNPTSDQDMWVGVWWLTMKAAPLGIVIYFAALFIDQLRRSIKRIINPSYYAAEDLFSMVTGRKFEQD